MLAILRTGLRSTTSRLQYTIKPQKVTSVASYNNIQVESVPIKPYGGEISYRATAARLRIGVSPVRLGGRLRPT